MHCTFVVVIPLSWVVVLRSVLLGCSSSPPLGHPWGYFSFVVSVACFWVLPLGRSGLGCQPSPPRVAVSPAVLCLSRCHHTFRGCHPVCSWLSLVLPEVSVNNASADALTWTHHQCCLLESLGVSGLATDTLLQATRPRLIRPRPVSKWHATPTAPPSSTRAIWTLFLLPLRCDLWLFFGWHLLCPVCRRLCSGSGWQIPDFPPPLAYTWSSTRSSDNPPPAPGTSSYLV